MKQTKPIAVFDLDDTLIPSTRFYSAALAKLPEVPFTDFQNARKSVKDFLPVGHAAARNRLLYFKAFCESAGQFSPQKILTLQENYEDFLCTEIRNFWPSSGRDELFESLRLQYDIYILTNENLRTQLLKLSALGERFAACIRGMLTSEEAGVEKPHPDIFRKFISRFKLEKMSPKMFTIIGDNFEHDIQPALQLGWSAIQSTEFDVSQHSAGHTTEFQRVSGLHQIVQELLDRTEK